MLQGVDCRAMVGLESHETSPSALRKAGRRVGIVLTAVLVTWSFAARPSTAAEGLFLNWNDCPQGASAAADRNFSCTANTGQSELYCAFRLPQAMDQVIAIEIVVDIQSTGTTLPNWWHLENEVGCRGFNNLTAAADFPGTACSNMWVEATETPVVGVQGYIPTEPRGLATQARIKVAAAVARPTENPLTLNGTDMYYAARIIINHEKTIEPPVGACAGCLEPVCLVLNSILIGRQPGAPGGDYLVQVPGPSDANWATWQGSGANCAAVPIVKRAWGQIKSLYR